MPKPNKQMEQNNNMKFKLSPEKKRIFLKTNNPPKLDGLVLKDGIYKCPNIEANLKVLKDEGFTIEQNLLKADLFPFQVDGVSFIENHDGCCILSDDMGCIDGDAMITVNRGGNSRKYKLSDAYNGFNGLRSNKCHNWDKNIKTNIRCLKDGIFGLNSVKDIKYSGKKECIEIETKSGKSLKLTPDHELLNCYYEWMEAKDFRIGDGIVVNSYRATGIKNIDMVVKITKCDEINTYDIVMEDPYRNFVANGIVVHNCGKTIQTLGYLAQNPDLRPAIITCPASLKGNWEAEINKFMYNFTVTQLHGKTPYPFIYDFELGIYIINYDILDSWKTELRDLHAKVIVADELHYLKNTGTKKKPVKRTRAFQYLAKTIPHRIGLTGTLMQNRPIEIYTPVNLISPNFFGKRMHYAKKYCNAKYKHWGWDFTGSSNEAELHARLQEISIRRTKNEVLKDLPPKIKTFLPVEISNRKEYLEAETDFLLWLKRKSGPKAVKKASNAIVLTRMNALRQIASYGKIIHLKRWISDFLETDAKLIVFTYHKNMINELYEPFKSVSVKIDGSIPATERQSLVDKFQNNKKTRVFFGNLSACSEGLTLTAASYVMYAEYPWQPGKLAQSGDRAYRYGQLNTVNMYYMVASNTIEEHMVAMLDAKQEVLSKVLDGKEADKGDIISELKKKYLRG